MNGLGVVKKQRPQSLHLSADMATELNYNITLHSHLENFHSFVKRMFGNSCCN